MSEFPSGSSVLDSWREAIAYPLRVGSLDTRVLQWGDGPREVLFLHGAGARADRWVGSMQTLDPDRFKAVAIDFPGHGFSTKGGGLDYSIGAFAEVARDALRALGMQRPALVGTSMGGHVAATMAVREPELAAGLALVGSVGLVPIPDALNQLIAAALMATSREYVIMKLHAVLGDKSLITRDLVEAEWRINNSAGAGDGFAKLAEYWLSQHPQDLVGPQLAQLRDRLPMRLIWGSEDRTTPLEMGLAAAELLTNGEIFALPGGGHAPYLDAPLAFRDALLPFLDSLDWSLGRADANPAGFTP